MILKIDLILAVIIVGVKAKFKLITENSLIVLRVVVVVAAAEAVVWLEKKEKMIIKRIQQIRNNNNKNKLIEKIDRKKRDLKVNIRKWGIKVQIIKMKIIIRIKIIIKLIITITKEKLRMKNITLRNGEVKWGVKKKNLIQIMNN